MGLHSSTTEGYPVASTYLNSALHLTKDNIISISFQFTFKHDVLEGHLKYVDSSKNKISNYLSRTIKNQEGIVLLHQFENILQLV